MKSFLKRFMSLLAVVCMAVFVSGCSGDTASEKKDKKKDEHSHDHKDDDHKEDDH